MLLYFLSFFVILVVIMLYVDVLKGENDYYRVEFVFKVLVLVLWIVFKREGIDILSIKGVL